LHFSLVYFSSNLNPVLSTIWSVRNQDASFQNWFMR
jgi:hypothetical protein